MCCVLIGEGYRNICAQALRAHLLSQESRLKSTVFERTPGRNDLRPEDVKGRRVELLGRLVRLDPKDREALRRAVIQDLDHLRPLIGEPEVRLVEDEGTTDKIQHPKDRRDGGSSGGEDWLVAEGADGQEEAGLPASGLTADAKVRDLVKTVVQLSIRSEVR